nr:immunoglobulin light chain junction region [Macaca mulatta]
DYYCSSFSTSTTWVF